MSIMLLLLLYTCIIGCITIEKFLFFSGNLNEETTKMKEERGLYQYCET